MLLQQLLHLPPLPSQQTILPSSKTILPSSKRTPWKSEPIYGSDVQLACRPPMSWFPMFPTHPNPAPDPRDQLNLFLWCLVAIYVVNIKSLSHLSAAGC